VPGFTELGLDAESKALGGKLGQRIGGGLRAAPPGMSFVDVTGRVDADNDGIVFEGLPLERPIIPRFIVPRSIAKSVAKLTEGDSEEIERKRRAGNANISFSQDKLQEIVSRIDKDSTVGVASNAQVDSAIDTSVRPGPNAGRVVRSTRSIRERIPLEEVLEPTDARERDLDDDAISDNQFWQNLRDELEKRFLESNDWTDDQKKRIKNQVSNLIMNLRAMRDDWQSMGRRERSGILRREKLIDGFESHPDINMTIDEIIKGSELRVHDDGTISLRMPTNTVLRRLLPGDRDYHDTEILNSETILSIFDEAEPRKKYGRWHKFFDSIFIKDPEGRKKPRLARPFDDGEELPFHEFFNKKYREHLKEQLPSVNVALSVRTNEIAAMLLKHYVIPELEKVPRNERAKIAKQLIDNDFFIHGYLQLMSDPHAIPEVHGELSNYLVSPLAMLHDIMGHFALGNTFDRHSEWGNILALISLARDKDFWNKLRELPGLESLTDEDREVFIRSNLMEVAARWLGMVASPDNPERARGRFEEIIRDYDGPIDELLDRIDPPSTRSSRSSRSMRQTPLTDASDDMLTRLAGDSLDGILIRNELLDSVDSPRVTQTNSNGVSINGLRSTRERTMLRREDPEYRKIFGKSALTDYYAQLGKELDSIEKAINHWEETGDWLGEDFGVAAPRVSGERSLGSMTNITKEELLNVQTPDEQRAAFQRYRNNLIELREDAAGRLRVIEQFERGENPRNVDMDNIRDHPEFASLAKRGLGLVVRDIRPASEGQQPGDFESDDVLFLTHTGVPILDDGVLDPEFTAGFGEASEIVGGAKNAKRANERWRTNLMIDYQRRLEDTDSMRYEVAELEKSGGKTEQIERLKKSIAENEKWLADNKIFNDYASAGREHLSYSPAETRIGIGYARDRDGEGVSRTYLVAVPKSRVTQTAGPVGMPWSEREYQIFDTVEPIASIEFKSSRQYGVEDDPDALRAATAYFERIAKDWKQENSPSTRSAQGTRSSRYRISTRSEVTKPVDEQERKRQETRKRATEKLKRDKQLRDEHARVMLENNSDLYDIAQQVEEKLNTLDETNTAEMSRYEYGLKVLNSAIRLYQRPLYAFQRDSAYPPILMKLISELAEPSPQKDRILQEIKEFMNLRRGRMGGNDRVLANDFISAEDLANSFWHGAWIYPDGRIYPVLMHELEHGYKDSFEDGLVRLLYGPSGGINVDAIDLNDKQIDSIARISQLSDNSPTLTVDRNGQTDMDATDVNLIRAERGTRPPQAPVGEIDLLKKPTADEIRDFLRTEDFVDKPDLVPEWFKDSWRYTSDDVLASTRSRTVRADDGATGRRNRITRRRGERSREEDIAEGLAEIQEELSASPWEKYSILQDDDGVYYADRISPRDVMLLRAGKLKPPAYPFFAPRGGGISGDTGEGYYFSITGQKFNGRYGAAGALVRRRRGRFGQYEYLLARRSPWMSSGGGKWSFPGGVHKDKDSSEFPMETAVTEFMEEVSSDLSGLLPIYSYHDQRAPDWAYDTYVYEVGRRDLSDIRIGDGENTEVGWFTGSEIMDMNQNGQLLPSFGVVARDVLVNSGDSSLIEREPGSLGKLLGRLRGPRREADDAVLSSTRSTRSTRSYVSPTDQRKLAVRKVDIDQQQARIKKEMEEKRLARNASLVSLIDDITKLLKDPKLDKNSLREIRWMSRRSDFPLRSPSITLEMLQNLERDIIAVKKDEGATGPDESIGTVLSNVVDEINRRQRIDRVALRGANERPLRMKFITADEFVNSDFYAAWLYPDGTLYPSIGEHGDEHDFFDSFDDGLVRFRTGRESVHQARDSQGNLILMPQTGKPALKQYRPQIDIEAGNVQLTDAQIKTLERLYKQLGADKFQYSIHNERELNDARYTGRFESPEKEKTVTFGVLGEGELSAIGDTLREVQGDEAAPVPRSDGYEYRGNRSVTRRRVESNPNIADEVSAGDDDIEPKTELMSTRSRRGKNRKKWNVTGDKKVTGDMKKLTPEQVRQEQEQKRRATKIPGKRKEGPSSREWLNITRSTIAPGSSPKEQYINGLSAMRAGGELRTLGRPLSSQSDNGSVSYISFGSDIKPGDILPDNFMQSIASQGDSRYSVASVQRMQNGVNKLFLRDLATGNAISAAISDDQQLLSVSRPVSTRSGRTRIPAVWRDTVEDFRTGATQVIVSRVRGLMQELEDARQELRQLEEQFDTVNYEWPNAEMESRSAFLDESILAVEREINEIFAATQHLVREERQAALTAAAYKKAKKQASGYTNATERFGLDEEDWADVLALLEYDSALERSLFDTGPQGTRRPEGMARARASQLAEELNDLARDSRVGDYIDLLEVDSIRSGKDIDDDDKQFINKSASDILENAILSVRRKRKLADAKQAVINTTAREIDEQAVLAILPSTRSAVSPRITSRATVKMGTDLRNSEQLFPGRSSKFSNSAISFVAYDGNRNELIVGRNGGMYRYGGMSDEIVDTFIKSRKSVDASLNQLDKDSSYTVSPDGSRRGLVPGLAQLLDRDARRLKLGTAETSVIKNLAKGYSASSRDEIYPIDPIRAHVIAKKLFANQETAAAINIIDALDDSKSARLLPEGIAPLYRSLPKTPSNAISIILDNNDAGIVRDELAELKKRFANNREIVSSLDVYDKLIAGGQSGGLKTAFSMSPGEYEFIRDGITALRSSNMTDGVASAALLDHAASAPKLKFDATELPQNNGTSPGSLFNSGAPYSLNRERRQELLDWAQGSNMKVAQSLADEKFKTIATWKSLEAIREFSTPTRSSVGSLAVRKGGEEAGTPFADMAPADYAEMAPLDKLSWIKANMVQEGSNKGIRQSEAIKQAKEVMDALNIIEDNLSRRKHYENVIYGNGSGTAATPNFAKSWESLNTRTRDILDNESRDTYSNDFRNLNNSQAADIVRRLRPEADKRKTGINEIPENDLNLIWDDVMASSQKLLEAIDKRRELGLRDEVLDRPRVPAREPKAPLADKPTRSGMELPLTISAPPKAPQTRIGANPEKTPGAPSNPTAAKVRRQRTASGIGSIVGEYRDELDSVYSNRYQDDRHSQVWNDIQKLFVSDNGAGRDFGIGNIDDAIDILDDYLTSDFVMDAIDGKPNGFAPRTSTIGKKYVQDSIERVSATRNYLNKLRNELMNDEFIDKTPGRGASLVRSMPNTDAPPSTRYVPRIRGRAIDAYFAARKNEIMQSTRSTRSSTKEGRAEIRAERTKFNELLNSLDREIVKADDPRHVAALRLLKKTLTRQKSGKLSDQRTNSGALYLTQDEIDEIIEALYVALDRQVERGSEARTALFGEMAELMAKAAMATFINKTAEPVHSRTITKINENGDEVEIALNE